MQALFHPLFQTLYIDSDGIFWTQELFINKQKSTVCLSIENTALSLQENIELASSILVDLDVLDNKGRIWIKENVSLGPDELGVQFWENKCQQFHNSYLQQHMATTSFAETLNLHNYHSYIPLQTVGIYPEDTATPVILEYSFFSKKEPNLYVFFSMDAEPYRISISN